MENPPSINRIPEGNENKTTKKEPQKNNQPQIDYLRNAFAGKQNKPLVGGKTRKTSKTRKSRKSRKTKKTRKSSQKKKRSHRR